MWNVKKFAELNPFELYQILRLRSEIFVVEQNCIYLDMDNKDFNSYHLFYEESGEVVAYSRIVEKNISYAEISIGRVVVDKRMRGKGLAQEMLREGIRVAKEELNETEIRISAQAHLQGLYRSVGFVTVSEEYFEDGIPHVEMFLCAEK